MKSNGKMDGSNQPGLIQDPKIFASWALYYSKVITTYASIGIDFWGITIQNEPEFPAPWEACCYNPAQQRDFLKNYLGPQLRKDHPQLKIMIYDHNKDHVVDWVRTIFTDPQSAALADGTAFHWYSGPQFENLAEAHKIAPSKFLLATEACNCPPAIGDWGHGEDYGYDIIGDLNNWSVGWTDWNVLLDLQGGPNHLNNFCDAPILADISAQKLIFQPPYWYMGQISRFITPGSVVLNTTVTSSLSSVSALTRDGKTVVVVQNQSDNPIIYTLQDGNNYARLTSPSHSIQTLMYSL
jgi:glucosylceramidase